MFTVKLHEYGPQGLTIAVLYTAESVEITLDEENNYVVDLYHNGDRTNQLILRADRYGSVFVENAQGKTVQRVDSKAHPKP